MHKQPVLILQALTQPPRTSGFMVCEQQFFLCYKRQGLGKQYLEPTHRYAVHYPICWNVFLCLPVTLARTLLSSPANQTVTTFILLRIQPQGFVDIVSKRR